MADKGNKGKVKKETEKGKPVAKDTSQLLGIDAKKHGQFAEWYTQIITRAEMIDYYDVSGCYILRPWSYSIWERIQDFFDKEIKAMGVQNTYFPLFVSQQSLNKEEDDLEGFGAEVAWVTKSGNTDLSEPIAVRPTSETVMYPAFKNWIRSHRDMPLKINQWCNIVRWEFKNPVPFIRSREFLWQEGHSAFATLEESKKEVVDILNLYARVYEELLAVPVVKGTKSDKEKFAGALYTHTVEAFVSANGRAVQAGTSHCLGQTFSKMFGVEFETAKHDKEFAWQNSWGLTTRSIGVMIMVHGDDKGLVLPPRVAPLQVVVIPLSFKNIPLPVKRASELAGALQSLGIRTHVDSRESYTPGWKYNHWEVKGVPLRIELGPKDIAEEKVVVVRRDTGMKQFVKWTELCSAVPAILEDIQTNLFRIASEELHNRMVRITRWYEFVPELDRKNLCLVPWCQQSACEEDVKARSGEESKMLAEKKAGNELDGDSESSPDQLTGSAKVLCMPWDQPPLDKDNVCFACGKPANTWALFGRSY